MFVRLSESEMHRQDYRTTYGNTGQWLYIYYSDLFDEEPHAKYQGCTYYGRTTCDKHKTGRSFDEERRFAQINLQQFLSFQYPRLFFF